MATTYKRRKFFINSELQGRYILRFFIVSVLTMGVFFAVFGYLSADNLTIRYQDARLEIGQTTTMLFADLLRANWIYILTAGVLVSWSAVLLTHRMAGPLFRFEKALEQMNARNLTGGIVLRPKDEGQGLARELNDFNEMLSSDIHQMQALVGELSQIMKSGEESPQPEQAAARCARLQEILQQYRTKTRV